MVQVEVTVKVNSIYLDRYMTNNNTKTGGLFFFVFCVIILWYTDFYMQTARESLM